MKHSGTATLSQPVFAPVGFHLNDDDLSMVRASLTGTAKERETDVLGWYQALPELLANGREGHYALMHDGQVVSVWDTHAEAIAAGCERFPSERSFWAGEIKQRELDKLQRFLAQERSRRCPN